MCKLMEHVQVSNLMKHVEKNNIFYILQHGFRKGLACETQPLEFLDHLTSNLQNNHQIDTLIMDFSKAFDKVSHSRLIYKLQHYGVQGKANAWILAFLSNRTQAVILDGDQSSYIRVESGVP
ncbi:MAG: reverse transcriptase domain-containing protein, partial [Chromatiales bacterium]